MGAGGASTGKLKDAALQALVKELGAQNRGLCLITSRIEVADLEAWRWRQGAGAWARPSLRGGGRRAARSTRGEGIEGGAASGGERNTTGIASR